MSNACTSTTEAAAIAQWWAKKYPNVGTRFQGLYVYANEHCLTEEDLNEARCALWPASYSTTDFVPDSFYEQLTQTLRIELRHLGAPFWVVQDEKFVVASGPSVEWLKGWRECLIKDTLSEPHREKHRARYAIIDGKRLVDMVRLT